TGHAQPQRGSLLVRGHHAGVFIQLVTERANRFEMALRQDREVLWVDGCRLLAQRCQGIVETPELFDCLGHLVACGDRCHHSVTFTIPLRSPGRPRTSAKKAIMGSSVPASRVAYWTSKGYRRFTLRADKTLYSCGLKSMVK